AHVQHVQPDTIDVIGDAETIGSDDGKACRAGSGGDGVLCRAITDFRKTGGEYHPRADPATRTSLRRFPPRRGPQRADGEVHARGQFVRAFEYRPAVDRLATAADQMNVAREIVELERLQNDLSGAAGACGHSDDGD